MSHKYLYQSTARASDWFPNTKHTAQSLSPFSLPLPSPPHTHTLSQTKTLFDLELQLRITQSRAHGLHSGYSFGAVTGLQWVDGVYRRPKYNANCV